MDWVPGVSQAKSLVQTVSGDTEGAKQTQKNFTDTFPIVSQAKSIGLFLKGHPRKAKDIQKTFVKNVGNFVNEAINSTPIVGHIKGAVHYAIGDPGGGKDAIDSANHVSGAIIGGTGGFVAGGPTGAFVGGVLGANAVDLALTGAESAIKGTFKPHGRIEEIANLANGNTDSKAGDTFDIAMGFILDGLVGQVAGANNYAQTHVRGKAGLTNYKPDNIVQNATKIEKIKQKGVENIEKTSFIDNSPFRPLKETQEKENFEAQETQVSESQSEYNSGITKVLIDPCEIKFSEHPLEGYSPQAQVIIDQMIEDLHRNGWVGEPINVVKMPNGELFAFDNRKLYCAIQAGIEAPIVVWDENERMPISLKLSLDENISVWGEAITFLINKSSPAFIKDIESTPIG